MNIVNAFHVKNLMKQFPKNIYIYIFVYIYIYI